MCASNVWQECVYAPCVGLEHMHCARCACEGAGHADWTLLLLPQRQHFITTVLPCRCGHQTLHLHVLSHDITQCMVKIGSAAHAVGQRDLQVCPIHCAMLRLMPRGVQLAQTSVCLCVWAPTVLAGYFMEWMAHGVGGGP